MEPAEVSVPVVPKVSVTGERSAVRAKLDSFAEQGITEVAYQPIGPDVERELTAFAEAALA